MKLLLLPMLLAQVGAAESSTGLALILAAALSVLTSGAFWGVVMMGAVALGTWLWKDKSIKRLQALSNWALIAFNLTEATKAKTPNMPADDIINAASSNFLEVAKKYGVEPTLKEKEIAAQLMEALWGQKKSTESVAKQVAQTQVREAVAAGVATTLAPVLARLPGGEAIHTPESFVATNPKETANQAGAVAHPSMPLAAKSTGG